MNNKSSKTLYSLIQNHEFQTIMIFTWRNWPSSGGWFLGSRPLRHPRLRHWSPTWSDRLLCSLSLKRRRMMKKRGFWIYSCYCPPGFLCPSVVPSLLLCPVTRPSAPESTVSLCPESRSQTSAACARAECRWAGLPRDLCLLLLLLCPPHRQMLLQYLSPQSWCPGCGWRALSRECCSVSGPGRPLPCSGIASGWAEPGRGNTTAITLFRKYSKSSPRAWKLAIVIVLPCVPYVVLLTKTRVCAKNKEAWSLFFYLQHIYQNDLTCSSTFLLFHK